MENGIKASPNAAPPDIINGLPIYAGRKKGLKMQRKPKYIRKPLTKIKDRENAKIRYDNRKTKGICVKCGNNKAVKNQLNCLSCRDKQAEYRLKNKDRITKYRQAHPKKYPETSSRCGKEWRAKHPGYYREYYHKNIEKLRAYARKYNGRRKEYFKSYYQKKEKEAIKNEKLSRINEKIRIGILKEFEMENIGNKRRLL